MQFMSVSLASGLLLVAAGAAAGGPAPVTAELDLYTRPGSEYRIADVRPPGTAVKVLDCGVSWCRVAGDDGMAYSSRSDLELGNPVSAEVLPSSVVPLRLLFAWHHGWSGRYWHHHWYQQH